MPVGPVALRELLTSGRKRRYFALRLIFGTALLSTIFASFGRQFDGNMFGEQAIGVNQRNAFARETVETIVLAQTLLVYVLTPALVAGAIGVEVKSKTLLYLLASPLTSREIVLGKLFARTARVAEFLAISVPILCLMPIYGTFEPKYLATLLGYAPSAAAMVAGVSMLVSTLIRSPREAIAAVYVLEFVALVLPPFLVPYVGDMPSYVRDWTYWYVLQVRPLPPGFDDLSKSATFWYEYSFKLFAFQWMIGAVCVGASCALLRPSALAEVSLGAIFRKKLFSLPKSVERFARRRLRIVARRPCGDDPMLWKEIEVGASGRYLKLAAIVFALLVAGACFAAFYEILYAYFEIVSNGRLTIENRLSCDIATAGR